MNTLTGSQHQHNTFLNSFALFFKPMRINEFRNYLTWEKLFQVHLIWYSSSILKWYPVGHLHKGGVWLSHKGGHSVIPSSGSSTFHDVILTSIMTLAENSRHRAVRLNESGWLKNGCCYYLSPSFKKKNIIWLFTS